MNRSGRGEDRTAMDRRWRAGAAVMLVALGMVALIWYGSRSAARVGAPGSPPGTAFPPPPTATPSPAPRVSPGGAASTLPSIAVEESRITGTDPAGRLRWEQRAGALVADAERQEVRLERVEGTFFERGTAQVTFVAPRGIFSMKTQDVTLSGGVRARAISGRLLAADRVQWLAARRLLVASGKVRLVVERMTVWADRLESDIGLRRTRLSGNITVTVRE